MSLFAVWRALKQVLVLSLALTAMGCHSQEVRAATDPPPMFAPAQVRTLRDFGAHGDGKSDDTAAIARALAQSNRHCLDGEHKAYQVTGTLRVTGNLCLRNLTLRQRLVRADTAPFIHGSCRPTQDPAEVIDCGGPGMTASQVGKLSQWLSVRTLLIRPQPASARISVNLERVSIDRGPYTDSGSRSDSAGIWLEGANRVDFRDVEISGNGKGYGLMLARSRNVTLVNLWIHDMVWSPYVGDTPLVLARTAARGWNSAQIREFREARADGQSSSKFYAVRIQEQITCAFLMEVHHVRIYGARIERCMARFDKGDVPWQADGLDIGRSSSDVSIDNARVESTWEGVDLVGGGTGIDRLTLSRLKLINSFSFGLKAGYRINNLAVTDLVVEQAGLGGVVLYGAVRGAHISGASISEVGVVEGASQQLFPWPPGNRAGFRIDQGPGGNSNAKSSPSGVHIDGATVRNAQYPGRYEFGLLDTGEGATVSHFDASGYAAARLRGPVDER